MTIGKSNYIKFLRVITLLVLSLSLNSCARQVTISQKITVSEFGPEFGNVKLDELTNEHSQENYSQNLAQDNLETLGSGGTHSYNTKMSQVRLPIISLHLDSGLMRSIGHVVVLKTLLTNNIDIRLISGEGVGAIIASMFAFGETPESIEWAFHRFASEALNLVPFTKEWQQAFSKNILSFFRGKKIENSKIPLLIYFYNKRQNKIVVINRGDLEMVLLNSLEWGNFNSKSGYTTSAGRVGSRINELYRFGADITILSQTVGNEMKLSRPNDYVTGIYARMVSVYRQIQLEEDWSSVVSLDLEQMDIDTLNSYPSFLKNASNKVTSWCEEFLNIKNDWQPGPDNKVNDRSGE